MEIKGRLIKVLPAQTGQGKNGEWRKQGFVIELEGTYPRKVCFQAWGDKVNVGALIEGTMLNVFFDAESREFNGKWYTDLTTWKVEPAGENQQESPPMPPMETYQPDMDVPLTKDDLPF